MFTEVVVAPGFVPEALEILAGRKSLRGCWACPAPAAAGAEWRRIDGGLLLQSPDLLDAPATTPPAGSWWPATRPPPTCWPISPFALAEPAVR